jgi:TolB-like protein/class 3 adenylate cyclase
MERRLSAILAADVVGYSALMEQDEAGTFDRLRAGRKELFEPEISKHHGRIFKLMGDGLLVEFGSVVDAVECAAALQRGMAERNASVPEKKPIEVRIGINLGEVIVEGEDRYGEGVNVAARLQQLADPGGICVSAKVSKEVEKRLAFGFEPMGEQRIKNMTEPIACYRVCLQPLPLAVQQDQPNSPRLPNKVAIAVLPFINMSGDPAQQYFTDGVTEDIITELSRFRELIVISRTSSFAFRDHAAPVAEIARKLGVHYVVEGSIRKSGKRARITAQLIDANGDKHIWAEHYDRELKDIFEVQDDVVHRITGTLVGRLENERQERAKRQSRSELRAYDIYLRAREHFFSWSQEENRNAAELLQRAIEIEPDYAAALALLSEVHSRDWFNGWSLDPENDLANSRRLAARAIELDDEDSRTHTSMGVANLFRNEPDRAKHHFETALRLNPSDARVLIYYSRHAVFDGRPELGIELVRRALELNPFGKYNWYLGLAKFAAHSYEEAISLLRNVRDPSPAVEALLAGSFAQLDRMDEAKTASGRFFELAAKMPMMQALKDATDWRNYFSARWPFRDKADLEHLLNALRRAGLPIST